MQSQVEKTDAMELELTIPGQKEEGRKKYENGKIDDILGDDQEHRDVTHDQFSQLQGF